MQNSQYLHSTIVGLVAMEHFLFKPLVFYFAALVAIVAVTAIGAVLPICLRKVPDAKHVVSVCNIFACGVFLGVAFVHMLPDASEHLSADRIGISYPLSYFLCALCYAVTFVIDRVLANRFAKLLPFIHTHDGSDPPLSYGAIPPESHDNHEKVDEEKGLAIEEPMLVESKSYGAANPTYSVDATRLFAPDLRRTLSESDLLFQSEKLVPHDLDSLKDELASVSGKSASHRRNKHGSGAQRRPTTAVALLVKQMLRPMMIALVLSFHAFLTGMAFGIETVESGVITLIAILFHKWGESFALGLSCLRHGVPKITYATVLTVFCFVTPAGMCTGLLLKFIFADIVIVTGIFESLAAGTFLYVTMVSLQDDWGNHVQFAKCIALFAGFGLMSLVALWV